MPHGPAPQPQQACSLDVDSSYACLAVRVSHAVSSDRVHACRPRTTVLGSRQQLCLHPSVSKLSGGAANQACRGLVASRTCSW